MMKKDEKITISKKLADDLLWWIQNIPLPKEHRGWTDWYKIHHPSQMEFARDSMVDELKQAIKKAEKEND